jgi:hypothetical protein
MIVDLEVIARFICGGIGSILLYMAWFLYESEEQTIQSRLEEWWIRFDELRSKVVSRQAAFLKILAENGISALNRLFGESLSSGRALLVIFPLVAYFLVWAIGLSANELSLALSFPAVAIAVFAGTIMISVGLTLATVHVVRRVLLWVARSRLEWPIFLLAGFMPLIFVFLSLYSLSLSAPLWSLAHIRIDGEGLSGEDAPVVSSFPFFLSTGLLLQLVLLILAIISMLQGAAVLMLAHRATWPFLSRVFYSVSRYRLIYNKKILNVLGFMMITVALAPRAGWGRLLKMVGAG